MVDVAKYFLGFLKFESCGKCTTCREGIKRLYELVGDICDGKGTEETIKAIEDLSDTVEAASLCALGTTAINPVRSTLALFKDEYIAHIKDKKCPAAVCKELITFEIDEKACTGCMVCKVRCPQDAVSGKKKEPHVIDQAVQSEILELKANPKGPATGTCLEARKTRGRGVVTIDDVRVYRRVVVPSLRMALH